MNHTLVDARRGKASAGFTLIEVVVASSISTLVVAAVMTVFIWNAHQASECAKLAWSQNEAMRTSKKLTQYIRNASDIVAIDESQGAWVQLEFPDGRRATLTYSNAVPLLRDGRMYIERDDSTDMLVARGLTEIQSTDGYTTPVFSRTRTNVLRVAYRVAAPSPTGGRASDDEAYAAFIQFGVCLRNSAE